MSRVLCVDNEPAIVRLLGVILKRDGHQAVAVADARQALSALEAGDIDAVLLDLGLPDRDGLELLSAIRERSSVPVIVVSARSDVLEKVAALDLGASDYVTKPFDADELLARLRAALRSGSTPSPPPEILTYGPIRIDTGRHEVAVAGQIVSLTRKEFDVSRCLLRRAAAS